MLRNSLLLRAGLLASVASTAVMSGAPAAHAADPAPVTFDTTDNPPTPTPIPATSPELSPDSKILPSESDALAASATGCGDQHYCAWTGGYFSGPGLQLTVGHSYHWGNAAQASCMSSGTSGANWKNCASSVRNRSGYATAHYFVEPNGSGYELTEGPGGSHFRMGVFDNNVDSSVAL